MILIMHNDIIIFIEGAVNSSSLTLIIPNLVLLHKLIPAKPRCNQQRFIMHFLARINDNVLL